MFNKIKHFFTGRSANQANHVSKQYYSNLPEKQRLNYCYRIRTREEEPAYFTNVLIHFQGVPLSAPAKGYREALGNPHYKSKRRYNKSVFSSMIFKQKFCGLKAKSIINQLDDDMLNCVYYIEASDKITIRRIKEAIRLKYGISYSELPDHFVLADQAGGRLIFDCTFNTVVTYYQINETLNKKIEDTLMTCEDIKQMQYDQKQQEFAFAF